MDNAFVSDRSIVIDDTEIVSVVARQDEPSSAPVEDWGDVAIVPGTVNAHGHSFQNLLKGFADDRTFASWRDDVLYPLSADLDRRAIYAGALFAFSEAVLAGVTTTVDFFYLHDASNENAEAVVKAAHDVGVRLVFGRCFYDEDAPTRAPARYRENATDAVQRFKELAEAHAGDPAISVQPAPHSLHAASPDTIAVALEAAAQLRVPCHLHLAEARYEREQITSRYGTTPVRLLAREGLLDPRLVTIHTVWVDDEELDLLADAGVGVVHCPGANAFLGDGIASVPEMLARGIRVGLGPDGGCANNRQSVFDEMRHASLFAKARLTDGSALDAATAFRLGTTGGAGLLGLPVGEIGPGRHADLVGLDLNDLSLHPLATMERQIVNSMQSTAVVKVMVGGEIVASDHRTTKIDVGEVRSRVEEATRGWSRP
ncbi:MAG TPA: amidohydrolase family protein [Actinomycetota bacterium]|nr:amidohydrolase family protein [Actinomycetota bacterium]